MTLPSLHWEAAFKLPRHLATWSLWSNKPSHTSGLPFKNPTDKSHIWCHRLYVQHPSCLSAAVPPQRCLVHCISGASCDVAGLPSDDVWLIDWVSHMCKCVNITHDREQWPNTDGNWGSPAFLACGVSLYCGLTATLSGWTAQLQQ